jgi:hypothetical protein
VLGVAGLPGYGKTHYVQAGLGERRAVIIDPHATLDRQNHGAHRATWEGELTTYDELLAHDFDLLRAFTGRLVIDPGTQNPDVRGRRVSDLLDLLWVDGHIDIVLEEAGLYSREAVPMINTLATGSGHNGVRLILISQSIGRITIDARRNFSRLALWPQSEPEDYRELRGKLGKAGVRELATMPEPPPYRPPVTWRQGQVPEDTLG